MDVDVDVDVETQPQPQIPIQTQPSPTHHGTVSDTGLPVQSIQESVDSRGNRIVIIEELDTPATRREKTKRVKAERARLAAEAVTHTTSVEGASGSGDHEYVVDPAPADPVLQTSQEESDLSSLSGNSDEASEDEGVQASTSAGRGRGRAKNQGKAGHPKSPGLGNISLPSGDRLESGTLGISPRAVSAFGTGVNKDTQFGRNTSRTLGGAPSCTMMTYQRSQKTSCNGLIMRETIS